MDPDTALCRGCLRTLNEIAIWGGASERQKLAILRDLAPSTLIDRNAPVGMGNRIDLTALARRALSTANRARRPIHRLLRVEDYGVHAIALTPAKRIILVRHSYAEGWFCPGGGKKRRETPKDGVLRELREEIGIRSWSTVHHLGHFDDGASPASRADAFLVREVAYRPRWSLEIAEVREFSLDELPAGLSGPTMTFLAAALPHIG